MAKTANSGNTKRAKPASSDAKKSSDRRRRTPKEEPEFEQVPLLDERSRRDIWGVVCAVVAIALFVVTALPADALVTSWLSRALHLGLGIGSYVLPFVLLLIAASLFIKREGQQVPARISIGLLLIFFAFLVLMSLFTPGVVGAENELFVADNLTARGGYIGAGVAWVLLLLLGQVVSVIIMIGVIAIALIIIGFSISSFIERIASLRTSDDEEDDAVSPALPALPARDGPSAKRLRGREKLDAAETVAMGKGHRPRKATSSIAGDVFAGDAPSTSKALTRKLGADPAPKSAAVTRKLDGDRTADAEGGFVLPGMDLLAVSKESSKSKERESTLRDKGMLLQETLADFGINADVVGWVPGPTVTLFKIDLPSGVRVSRVTNLTDDIALAMAAPGVRIFAPIPGTNYVGIEVPNLKRQSVLLGDVLPAAGDGPLEIALGKDVEGRCITDDLAKMPHLLIAGTTGSGKSVSVNGMIMSILMRSTPAEVRFIMVDPKRVEFTPYNGIPHLYVPVVTECREAASALSWAVAEMERRLKVFSKVGARNIAQYNSKVDAGLKIGENDAEKLPYIVIVIDELADLMMNVGKEVEFSISRLAQLARAAGIHMIIATQRPSTNIVTGLIKANITNRISLSVASGIDSRVILDTTGAENLIGNGDMLLSKPELPKPQRLQGCFVTPDEISKVVDCLKAQGEPEYHTEILQTNLISLGDSKPDGSGGSGGGSDDPLLWDAAEIVVNAGQGSTSNIQRRLSVGYSRAGRIMDMLEDKGVVGPQNGSKPREVLVDTMELESLKAFERGDAESTGEE